MEDKNPKPPAPFYGLRLSRPDFNPRGSSAWRDLSPKVRHRLEILSRRVSRLESQYRLSGNVPISDLLELRELLDNPQLAIVLSDKGLGPVIVDATLLHQALDKKFFNPDAFRRLDITQATRLFKARVSTFLTRVNLHVNTAVELAETVTFVQPHTQVLFNTVQPLAKVHKPTFNVGTWRFIIQAQNSPFQRYDQFASNVIVPAVAHLVPTYLRDSSHLVHLLSKINLDKNRHYYIITADATDLYGNLELSMVLDGARFAYRKMIELGVLYGYKLPWNEDSFIDLLRLANASNFVFLRDAVFLQRTGIAMGRAGGVALANMALGLPEIRLFNAHPELQQHLVMCRRFIDDLFCVIEGPIAHVHDFIELYRVATRQTWNVQIFSCPPQAISDTAPFLDLGIYRSGSKLLTRLYQKPSSLGNFLVPFSEHPSHTHRGWISANLLRFARNCSEFSDFELASWRFFSQLRGRGFHQGFLRSVFDNFNFSQVRRNLEHYALPSLDDMLRPIISKQANKIFISIPFRRSTRVVHWTWELNMLMNSSLPWRMVHKKPLAVSTAWSNSPHIATYLLLALRFKHLGYFNPNPCRTKSDLNK